MDGMMLNDAHSNFIAVSEDDPMFLRAINIEGDVNRKEYIAEKLMAIIEEVRPKNVVHVSNMKYLSTPWKYWTF
jgi:hypothetical protein